MVSFPIITAVVFFLDVKPLNSLLTGRRVDREPEAPAADVKLLTEIRDLLRNRGESAATPSRPT